MNPTYLWKDEVLWELKVRGIQADDGANVETLKPLLREILNAEHNSSIQAHHEVHMDFQEQISICQRKLTIFQGMVNIFQSDRRHTDFKRIMSRLLHVKNRLNYISSENSEQINLKNQLVNLTQILIIRLENKAQSHEVDLLGCEINNIDSVLNSASALAPEVNDQGPEILNTTPRRVSFPAEENSISQSHAVNISHRNSQDNLNLNQAHLNCSPNLSQINNNNMGSLDQIQLNSQDIFNVVDQTPIDNLPNINSFTSHTNQNRYQESLHSHHSFESRLATYGSLPQGINSTELSHHNNTFPVANLLSDPYGQQVNVHSSENYNDPYRQQGNFQPTENYNDPISMPVPSLHRNNVHPPTLSYRHHPRLINNVNSNLPYNSNDPFSSAFSSAYQNKPYTSINPQINNNQPSQMPYPSMNNNCSIDYNRIPPLNRLNLKFNGKNQSLHSFLEKIEEFSLAHKIPKDRLLNFAHEFFENETLIWYRSVRNNINSWDELVYNLRLDFLPVDYEVALWDEIRARTQGISERPLIYIAIMENLFKRFLNPVPESVQLKLIVRNLLPYYQQQLSLRQPMSIPELKGLCRLIEDTKIRSDKFQGPPSCTSTTLEPELAYKKFHTKPFQKNMNISQLSNSLDNNSCFTNENHSHEICSSGNINSINTKVKCYNCDEHGHVFQKCTKKKNVFCYGCGQKNVIKSKCQACISKNEREAARISAETAINQN